MTHDTTANDALDLSGREPVLAFPVVGIGASAGGIDALRKFFEALPEKTGMAFVVVLHLHPEHESHLAELLGRVCKLPLQEVTEDTPLAPDHVFVIRPRFALTIEGGTLRLNPAGESPRHPVDTLFRSMADEQHEKAIAIVLSGSGSNGSAGALRIKEEGGAVFVQDPQTAQHDGMPLAAITNGVADLVLPPEDLPEKLLAFGRHPYVQAPAEVVRLR